MALAAILSLALVASVSGASFESRVDAAACGTHTMAEGERLMIQSPNFPNPYSTNVRCQWEISCPTETDHYLEFICPTFILESSTDCVNDRLVLTSRGTTKNNCGTNSPDGTKTSTGWARLTFFSNAATVKQGFRCYVWCRAIPTTTAATTTAATTTAATTTAATTTAATTTAATTTAATTTAATTTAATTTAATTTAATTTAATTTAATTTAATTTAATTTTATTTVATTTAATTTAATTTAATTTAATTTAATTNAATTTAATTTAATTTAATTTAATTTAATTTAATTTAATTTAATTTAAATTAADATTTAAATTVATTAAETTTAAATTVATTVAEPTTTAATTVADTTTAAATTEATTTSATTAADETTTAATTTADTTTAAATTADTTTVATTIAPTTTSGTTTTVGFDLKACGVHELVEGQRVVIETPNFPSPYTVDDRCQWEFSCPTEADHYLEFICPKFALESSTDCTADRLTVTSRGTSDVKCGSNSPDGTITSTGWARLTYFSNAKTVAAGFRCYVWCRVK